MSSSNLIPVKPTGFAKVRHEIKQCGEYRFGRYGSFWHRFALSRWQCGAALCKFDEHWALHLFGLWTTLWQTRTPPTDDMLDKWGFTFSPFTDRYLMLSWRDKTKFLHMPWDFTGCRTEIMLRDGSFVPYERFRKGSLDENPEPLERYRKTLPYRYCLRSGEHQEVQAVVTVERRTWHWRGLPFRWLRWPRKSRTSIDVAFSGEVGEQAGSWKGGTVGCGYGLKPGETPEECLRRMEQELKFD